ncbi:MAG: hypothetical protein BWX88_04302 [Planctomycetes bacterium ADurb.Bin126]|nr:MAG: hypothetical protein BWX88_04302 [Planctomycetes bacterium ADurb.Bin126]
MSAASCPPVNVRVTSPLLLITSGLTESNWKPSAWAQSVKSVGPESETGTAST